MLVHRIRLKSAAIALHYEGNKGRAFTIPTGAEILAPELDYSPGAQPNRTIEVFWNGKAATMFQIDLIERGEEMKAN
jgi:hypothetical protein